MWSFSWVYFWQGVSICCIVVFFCMLIDDNLFHWTYTCTPFLFYLYSHFEQFWPPSFHMWHVLLAREKNSFVDCVFILILLMCLFLLMGFYTWSYVRKKWSPVVMRLWYMQTQFRISQAFTAERNAIFPGCGLDCIFLFNYQGGHDIAVCVYFC